MAASKSLSRRRLAAVLVVAALAPLGCALRVEVPNLYEVKDLLVDYVDSGRYQQAVAAALADARLYLATRARRAGDGSRLAIVLDVDETSLSNLPAYRLNDWGRITSGGCDLDKGPCNLREWYALGRDEAIEPTLGLARAARELGIAVFFISGRFETTREATERNLRAAGYEPAGLILRTVGSATQSAADYKAPERAKLEAAGWTIVLNVGDQASDLAGGHAERTIKLPNPFYRIP